MIFMRAMKVPWRTFSCHFCGDVAAARAGKRGQFKAVPLTCLPKRCLSSCCVANNAFIPIPLMHSYALLRSLHEACLDVAACVNVHTGVVDGEGRQLGGRRRYVAPARMHIEHQASSTKAGLGIAHGKKLLCVHVSWFSRYA